MHKSWLLIPCAALLVAQTPPAPTRMAADQLASQVSALKGKLKDGVASQSLANWGNHSFMVIRREADGQAEFHENQADIIIVRAGKATMRIGGKVVGGKTTAPGEIRGTGIEGGEVVALNVGDVIHVDPKTPHQALLAKGQSVEYMTIKVDAK
jgi:mannose-6-phosphate isomerase-like protein (cupin superfamily)